MGNILGEDIQDINIQQGFDSQNLRSSLVNQQEKLGKSNRKQTKNMNE